MREMKDSGIEWIGEIPKDWIVIRLKYCFSGFTNGTSDTQLSSGESFYPVTRIETISSGEINLDKIGYVAFSKKQYLLKTGDILVSNINSIKYLGNCAIVRDGYKLYHGMNLLRIVPSDYIDNGYAYYLFKSNVLKFPMEKYCKPAINQASVSATTIKNFFIPFPALAEQQQIANFLDTKCSEIDATAEDIQKEITLLEEYKKSVITEAVTKGLNPDAEMKNSGIEWIGEIPKHWKVLRIKNVGEYRNGLTYKPTDLTDENTGTLVLRSSNIQDGKISLNDNVYVSTFVRSDLKVKKGDILICSRNGSRELVGKNAIIEDLKDVTFGAFMMIFRCNSPKYLYYILNSKVFSYYLGSFFTSTINQLTGSNFGNMKIVYVSDKLEQSKIVSYLDSKCSEIDSLIADKKRQLDILADYKKSLIYEYVTGKKEVPVNE